MLHKRKIYGKGGVSQGRRGDYVEVICAICNLTWMARKQWTGEVDSMKKCGGPAWDQLYCCASHTDFEIEVWRVKTKRRTTL